MTLTFETLPSETQTKINNVTTDQRDLRLFENRKDFETWYFDGYGPNLTDFINTPTTIAVLKADHVFDTSDKSLRAIELFYPTPEQFIIIDNIYVFDFNETIKR